MTSNKLAAFSGSGGNRRQKAHMMLFKFIDFFRTERPEGICAMLCGSNQKYDFRIFNSEIILSPPQKTPCPVRRFRRKTAPGKPSHWDAVRGLCQQQSPPFQNGGDCSLLLPFQVQQGRRTPKKSPGKCLGKHLANTPHSCYNRLEKQKCGSLRVLQHPQACTGTSTTYTTANPHRMDYYTTNRLFTQVPVCLYSPALCRQENAAPRAV
jgi:hypothetical protein